MHVVLGQTYYASCIIDGNRVAHGGLSPQTSPCRMLECQKGFMKDVSEQFFGKINNKSILNFLIGLKNEFQEGFLQMISHIKL